jgi:hypothetical protein
MSTVFRANAWTNSTTSTNVHLAEHQDIETAVNSLEALTEAAAAVSVQADITGGQSPTEAEFNALLASLRALIAALTA